MRCVRTCVFLCAPCCVRGALLDASGCVCLVCMRVRVCACAQFKFEIGAATVDPMTPEFDPSPLKAYVQSLVR